MLRRTIQHNSHRGSSGRSKAAAGLQEAKWAAMIPDEQWAVYRQAMQAVRASETPFMVGGGFAMAAYTDRWRNTKDIDIYLLPKDRDAAIEALTRAGYEDYHTQLPYDRGWIYRSTAGGVIVDVIWSMANRRAPVDEQWFDRAKEIQIKGEAVRVLPAEELLWTKLFVLQHDHCDWPDVLNLVYAAGEEFDWDHLLYRVDGDHLLLKAIGTIYDWLCPGRPEAIPKAVRAKLGLPWVQEGSEPHRSDRARLLDSRLWFVGMAEGDRPLEI